MTDQTRDQQIAAATEAYAAARCAVSTSKSNYGVDHIIALAEVDEAEAALLDLGIPITPVAADRLRESASRLRSVAAAVTV